jgi:sugar lactone lactonase YvrE
MKAEMVLDARAELGEGPAWLADRRLLLWVDITPGLVHLFDPSTGRDQVLEVGQPVGAAVPAAGDRLILAVRDGFALLEMASGRVELIAEVERHLPSNRMNDGKCDPAGRFWAGTMALEERHGAGCLYRLDGRRRVEQMIDGVGISNGIGWSPDQKTMYYIDTLEGRVDILDYEASTGAISNRRPLVSIENGAPDGMTVDAEGGLWVAVWGGSRVVHVLPDGSAAGEIELPVSRVTSCCFGGPELSDLYITTARQGLSAEERAAEPTAGSLFRCRPGIKGLPTNPYRETVD